jgi:hypothetical protein
MAVSPVIFPPARMMAAAQNANARSQMILCNQPIGKPAQSSASRWKTSLLLGAFGMRRLGMLVCVLRVLLSLSRMLLTLGVLILAVSVGSGAMRFCRGFVMLRCLVVCVFHADFSYWPENSGGLQQRPQ